MTDILTVFYPTLHLLLTYIKHRIKICQDWFKIKYLYRESSNCRYRCQTSFCYQPSTTSHLSATLTSSFHQYLYCLIFKFNIREKNEDRHGRQQKSTQVSVGNKMTPNLPCCCCSLHTGTLVPKTQSDFTYVLL